MWCDWCQGRGCAACFRKRKEPAPPPEPIFVARRDSPDDMEALKRIVGKEALEKAFGPGGGGMQEVEVNAALESLKQLLRKGAES